MIDCVSVGWVWRGQTLEQIEIDFDSVFLLRCCRTKVGQCLKALPIFGLGLIQPLPTFRPQPRKLLLDALIRSKPVVVRAEGICSVCPSHDAAPRRVAAQEQIVPPVYVGRRIARDLLADDRVVINKQPRWLGGKLERHAGHVIQKIANEVHRSAKHRLRAIPTLRGVDTAVVHDAHVVNAAVGLHEVIVEHMHVVVVDVDRRRPPLGVTLRRPVCRNAYRVVKIRDRIVRDHVPRPIHLDRVIARQQMRAIRPSAGPQRARPPNQPESIIAAEKQVVRNVEIA